MQEAKKSHLRGALWQKIWDRKHSAHNQPLHHADGFDLLDASQYAALTRTFINWMGPLHKRRVLEVGCGSGAFCLELGPCAELCGIDFSDHAIERIQHVLPGTFKVAEANAIPFHDGHFDCVFSFGVFFYFDSLDYARRCLEEQLRVLQAGGELFVFEVNDEEKRELSEEVRAAEARDQHKKSVSDVDHLFYNKCFFTQFAAAHHLECEIRDEAQMPIDFHSGARYRFSVRMKKNSF